MTTEICKRHELMYLRRDLGYLIANEFYVLRPLLRCSDFCTKRGIRVDRDRLERLERLEILRPMARGRHGRVDLKWEPRPDGDGFLRPEPVRPGERWEGDSTRWYSHIQFPDPDLAMLYSDGQLWAPGDRPFKDWATFTNDEGNLEVESFYSIFQCYTLSRISAFDRIEVLVDDWILAPDERRDAWWDGLSDRMRSKVDLCVRQAEKTEPIAWLCQVLSNRYYPETQGDQRTYSPTIPLDYGLEWWDEYCRAWDRKSVLDDLGATIEHIRKIGTQVRRRSHSLRGLPSQSWNDRIYRGGQSCLGSQGSQGPRAASVPLF
jgi:hypothetical protein